MKRRKWICRWTGLLVLMALVFSTLAGCSEQPQEDSGKLQIVATLFPQYDFARQIAGDQAEVTMLLPFGMESHTFDPKPADIMKVNSSDLFLYTGQYMEPWAQSLIDALGDSQTWVVDLSAGITLEEEGHDHDDSDDSHTHDYDPHIWTSPVNAITMVKSILSSLCAIDPDHAADYTGRAEDYIAQLTELDTDFRSMIDAAPRKEIVFGGRFAFAYFVREYGLEYMAAFDSCSSETEPSVQVMNQMINAVKEKAIPIVYYEEMTDPKVARAICSETGAQMRLLHSCHNVSKEEYDSGATYLTLMRQNLENLKEGLY